MKTIQSLSEAGGALAAFRTAAIRHASENRPIEGLRFCGAASKTPNSCNRTIGRRVERPKTALTRASPHAARAVLGVAGRSEQKQRSGNHRYHEKQINTQHS
jgi:hypothetical protein